MTELRERFGRPLRLGVIGGGPEAWIGRMHRGAAEMDGWWRPVAGVFSSDAARSRAGGEAMGFDPGRSYGDVDEMLRQERLRQDGIDAVTIVTPNDTHYPFAVAALDAGLDVVCDKPVTHDFAQACDLVARTRRGGRIFAVAHGYSAYPMTRYARRLVRDGVLGPVRLVQVEYIQSGMATRVEEGPQNDRLRWILSILEIKIRQPCGDSDGNDRCDDRADDDQNEQEALGDVNGDQRPVRQRTVEAAAENVSGAATHGRSSENRARLRV